MSKTSLFLVGFALLFFINCEPPKKANTLNNNTSDVSKGHTMTGFNAEYMIDVCLDGQFVDQRFQNVSLHTDCSEVVDALDPEVLRWPGGITANFYHFNGNGYGFVSSEVKGTEYAGNAERVQELLDINYIEIFLQVAIGRKVIFVANLLHGSVDENLKAINYLKDGGVDVIGVELGNEFYFSKMEPDDYIKRCSPYIERITDIKLAVHMAPDFGAKNQKWNSTVAKADVDAFVIHEYNRKVKNDCKQSDQSAYFDCALTKVDEFTGSFIRTLISNYKRKYGQKEIWLTEWNIAPRTKDVYGTYIQSYNNFKTLNTLNELDVEIALFHNLITSGSMYPVVTRKKEKLTYNPDYYVHMMVPKGMYLSSGRVGGCQLWYYADGVAIANPTGQEVEVDPTQFKGKNKYSTYEILVSPTLWDKPVHGKGNLSGITIPPYSLVVLR